MDGSWYTIMNIVTIMDIVTGQISLSSIAIQAEESNIREN